MASATPIPGLLDIGEKFVQDDGTMNPLWRNFFTQLLIALNSMNTNGLSEPVTLLQPFVANSTVTMDGTVPNTISMTLVAYANDAAAAAAGMPLGGLYKNAGFVKIRVV